MRWIPLENAKKKGWYVMRFLWDTHHENNGVAYCNGFCFERERENMIVIGPWLSQDYAMQAAGLEDES